MTSFRVLVQQGSTLTNDPAKGAHQVPPDGQCIIQDVRMFWYSKDAPFRMTLQQEHTKDQDRMMKQTDGPANKEHQGSTDEPSSFQSNRSDDETDGWPSKQRTPRIH
uniref:Uncharacterized protein LOC111123614 n=1 Tax=Crassostrea virginica TaxID=6565 RepID=A0A8B8D0V7_CRAVI|nr:uncharacterized protein LOC111123614 [Crassostrea virginica]XP_022321774.1 uncharacterized protein LOC111123615 [Crassostrea virginica]